MFTTSKGFPDIMKCESGTGVALLVLHELRFYHSVKMASVLGVNIRVTALCLYPRTCGSNCGGKILTVAELWRGIFNCGANKFICGGAATLNGPWRTLYYYKELYGTQF